jgi:hypothetical protein
MNARSRPPKYRSKLMPVGTEVTWGGLRRSPAMAGLVSERGRQVDEIAKAACGGVARSRHFVVAEIADEGSLHRPERLDPSPDK